MNSYKEYIIENGYGDLLSKLTVYKDGKDQTDVVDAFTRALYNTIKLVNNDVQKEDYVEPPKEYKISQVPSFENILGILAEYDTKMQDENLDTAVLATFNDIKNYVKKNEEDIKKDNIQDESERYQLRMIALNPVFEKITAWVYGGEDRCYISCLWGSFRGHYCDNHTEYYRKNVGLDYDPDELTSEQKEATGNCLDRSFIDECRNVLEICGKNFYNIGDFTKPYELVLDAVKLEYVIKDILLDLDSLNRMKGYGFHKDLQLDIEDLHSEVDDYLDALNKELNITGVNYAHLFRWERPSSEEEFKACLLKNSELKGKYPFNFDSMLKLGYAANEITLARLMHLYETARKDVDRYLVRSLDLNNKYSIPDNIKYICMVIQNPVCRSLYDVYYSPLSRKLKTELMSEIYEQEDFDEVEYLKYALNYLIDNENVYNEKETFEALLIDYCLKNIKDFYLKDMFEGKDYLELAKKGNRFKELQQVVEENFQ